MDKQAGIRVEVAYALPERQMILALEVPAGATVREAIEASGILSRFAEIDLERNRVGIFSKPVSPEQVLQEGDRVEIYRPLKADPKEVRRRLAEEGRTMRKGDRSD